MNYKEFMNELINDRIHGVYLFDSKEEHLNTTIINEVKNHVQIPDFNFIDIKESKDVETIKNSYETYPVMEDKKYIIWRGIDLSQKAVKEYDEVLTELKDDLEDFPSYANLLIFSDKSPYTNGKFYKAVKQYGTIVNIDRLDKNELESFIGRRFTADGKKIKKSLVAAIADRFSYLDKDSEVDLNNIVNVVDKIISNSTNEIVSPEDVNEQLDEVLNLSIFNLTDAISEKNSQKAFDVYLKMVGQDEDLFMVFHMIIRQIRNLIGIELLRKDGVNDNYIMKYLGIRNFELKKNKGFLRNFTTNELFDIHKLIFDMEVRQKSTDFDMERELLLLINKITTGK